MENSTASWTEKDFLAFALLCASNADMSISEDELKYIGEKIGDEHYRNAFRLFEDQSDYQNIQTIVELKKQFYPGEEGKVKLLGYLEELFQSDGQYSTMEQLMMRGLEKLI
ncbi:MAG: hypothetical protein AAF502_16725 [Bacteroidota bacterium]